MTERQKQTLARFLAASMVAGMLAERLVFHMAVQAGDALQYVGLSTLEIPHVDATFGYLLQRQQAVTWKAIALVGWVLPLMAVTLLCWRGRVAGTALCVAATAYALSGFAVVTPVTVGLITLSGLDAGTTVTPMNADVLQWFGYVLDAGIGVANGDSAQALGAAFTGMLGLGYVLIRVAIVAVAGWLAWSIWADRRDSGDGPVGQAA